MKMKSLAKVAGIQYATLHRIEHGVQEPKADELEKLVAALGVTMADLYADDALEPIAAEA